MVVKKKSKIISFAAIILLLLIIACNIVFSLAWFTDEEHLSDVTLRFGTVKIKANDTRWFSATQNYYASVKPNDIILYDDVKFNLDSSSQPVYIRVKYDVDTTSTNLEILKASNYLKYRELELSSSTDYKWSDKRGDYYYLLDAQGNPLAVETVRQTDYIFLEKNNSKISNDLEFDSTQTNNDAINMAISVEAIQTANILPDNGKTLIEKIEKELNSLNNVSNSNTYSVTFKLNGEVVDTLSGIAYGGSALIPASIQTAMNSSNFEGFSLWENGIGIIKNDKNNHSYIDNNKICNITENITLHVKNVSNKYVVKFYNGSNLIQTYRVNSGENAQYFGATPTKEGYVFTGWDKSLENITEDTTFYAQFESLT